MIYTTDQLIARAGRMRELMQSEGMKILRAEVDELAARKNREWLLADDETAAKIRTEAKGYEKLFLLVAQIILEGDNASRLRRQQEEQQRAEQNPPA